ncbi:MAG: hypothetical protein EOO50_10230 [Flavobacterium sp.]|uniref:hypothetical protein n=1 Tax=Flavobacterium sp. TaxID=239 RepID=UPI0012276AD3|nr:hypothetical protein [Flavobacterium sp.]RZJ66300.1 MAG: hypothetical protein EOO50_10230 [Flavobacterium sp.]
MKDVKILIGASLLSLITLASCRYTHVDPSENEESNPSVPAQEPAHAKRTESATISQNDTIDTKSSNPKGDVKPHTTGTAPDK